LKGGLALNSMRERETKREREERKGLEGKDDGKKSAFFSRLAIHRIDRFSIQSSEVSVRLL